METVRGDALRVAPGGSHRHPHSKTARRSLVKALALGLVAILLTVAFAHLGSEVGEGETRAFDLFFARGAHTLRETHPWLADVMRDWSGLGSTSVLALFTAVTVVYLALGSSWGSAAAVLASTLTGTLLVSTFKDAFGRTRPGGGLTELLVAGPSFPSGHASVSAVVFFTVGTLLASTRVRAWERAYILLVAVLLGLLVGISRVALGVHWATDVLGGWALGVGWAMTWLLLSNWLTTRGNFWVKAGLGHRRARHAQAATELEA